MRPIAPATGAPERTLTAPGQGDLPVALYEDPTNGGVALMRWTLTAEERAAVAAGADVFLAVLVGDDDLQPVHLQVGPGDYQVAP